MENPARKNGLQRPFHPFQVMSWILQVFNISSFYCTTIPCLELETRIPIIIIFTVLQLMVLLLGYKLSKSDPSDEIVEIFHNEKDKSKVLEIEEKHEKFCNFCRSPVNSTSKHCVRCNRCTKNFDHHCKWVNNCVGMSNYKLFIYLIVTCMCLEGFLLILCLNVVLNSVFNGSQVRESIKSYYNFDCFTFFVSIQGILSLEGGVFSLLLGYLIILHVYLAAKGLTTYEFILSKRHENRVIPGSKSQQNNDLNKSLGLSQGNNNSVSQLENRISSRV